MKKEVIRKYVKDLDGLIKEIKEWEEEFKVLHQTYEFAEHWMYEQGVIFLFGRLYKFFNFQDIAIWGRGLDADVRWGDEIKKIEFEVLSSGFKEHIKKGQVEPKDYRNTIIVCWENDWDKECPSDIDVIELKHLLKLAGFAVE